MNLLSEDRNLNYKIATSYGVRLSQLRSQTTAMKKSLADKQDSTAGNVVNLWILKQQQNAWQPTDHPAIDTHLEYCTARCSRIKDHRWANDELTILTCLPPNAPARAVHTRIWMVLVPAPNSGVVYKQLHSSCAITQGIIDSRCLLVVLLCIFTFVFLNNFVSAAWQERDKLRQRLEVQTRLPSG